MRVVAIIPAPVSYTHLFRRRFGGKNYYVPETVYQLQAILKYLGGNHGS